MTCSWNYRGVFCPTENLCNETETLGAYILHGNSQAFHNDIFPTIREVYKAFKEVRQLQFLSYVAPFLTISSHHSPKAQSVVYRT